MNCVLTLLNDCCHLYCYCIHPNIQIVCLYLLFQMSQSCDLGLGNSHESIDELAQRQKLQSQLQKQSMDSTVKCRIIEELYDWSKLTKDYVVFLQPHS